MTRDIYGNPHPTETMDTYCIPMTDQQSFEAEIENDMEAALVVTGELDEDDCHDLACNYL